MPRLIVIIACCVVALTSPSFSLGSSDEAEQSAYWSHRLHEENSLFASIIYFPYTFFRAPIGLISSMWNRKPTTQSTIPPAAHRVDLYPPSD